MQQHMSSAERAAATGDKLIRAVDRSSWRTRDIIIDAMDDFARVWTLELHDFNVWDPSDVKEMARWIGRYLEAAGRA